jgi:hypothetical protein
MATHDFKKREYEEDTQCRCCKQYFRILYYWDPPTHIPSTENRLYCEKCMKHPGYNQCNCDLLEKFSNNN